MTGSITLKDGYTWSYCTKDFKNTTALVNMIKSIVMEHCEHDINSHKSFKDAKKQRCAKCRLLVTK